MEFLSAPEQVWAAGLVFVRVGTLVMLMPGVGEQAVPPRIRLSFALLLALILFPVVSQTLPPVPATVGIMAGFVIKELLIGLALGALLRTLLATLAVAGEVMSLATTLSFAQTANPMQAAPGAALSTFLTMIGLVMIFATNTHHLFFGALVESYQIFAPTKTFLYGDAVSLMIRTLAQAFSLGIQMAAPVLVFSLVLNIAVGFVARVMPQFQVFFVATPLSVLFGLMLIALSLGGVGLVFIDQYETLLSALIRS